MAQPIRICHDCGRVYYRANRFRLWITRTTAEGKVLYEKHDIRVCTTCYKKREQRTLRLLE